MTIKDLKIGMKVYIRDDLQLGKFYGNCKYHTEIEVRKLLNKVGGI